MQDRQAIGVGDAEPFGAGDAIGIAIITMAALR